MSKTTKIMQLFRKSNSAYKSGHIEKAKIYQKLIRLLFSAELPYTIDIGDNADFLHGALGCVIHGNAVIGEGAKIYQNVTIGGLPDGGVPVIGKNVVIGAGAVLLGGIFIGDNVRIGANAVVLTDVPDGATAVGVPAKIILKGQKG